MSTFLKLAVCIAISVVGLVCTAQVILESHIDLSQIFIQSPWVLLAWRCLNYGLILILWPYAIRWIGLQQQWKPHTIFYVTQQRFKLLILFVIIELFFVYNVVGRLFIQF